MEATQGFLPRVKFCTFFDPGFRGEIWGQGAFFGSGTRNMLPGGVPGGPPLNKAKTRIKHSFPGKVSFGQDFRENRRYGPVSTISGAPQGVLGGPWGGPGDPPKSWLFRARSRLGPRFGSGSGRARDLGQVPGRLKIQVDLGSPRDRSGIDHAG